MRVFNLTDIPTPALTKLGLVEATIVVGRTVLGPGETTEAADDAMTRRHLRYFISNGAMAVGQLPPFYTLAKDKLPKKKGKK